MCLPHLPLCCKNSMKIKTSLLLTLAMLAIMASCGRKKDTAPKPEDFIRPASQEYTSSDSSNIKYLVNTYVEHLNKGEYNTCASMLYTFKSDSVIPYSDKQRAEFANVYSHLPIYGTRVKGIILRSDRNNQVDIAIQIAPQADYESGKGTIIMSLNPVQTGGKWYLTLRDLDADGTTDTYGEK